MHLSWARENVPPSNNSLKEIFSRLSKEYLEASEIVLSNPTAGKYLPDSLTLLEVLLEKAILFDLEKGAELHLHPWELKIEFLGLALYYAWQAKDSLPKKLFIHHRHAEVFRCQVLKQCADPFEVAAFDEGCEVWKYAEMLKKELAIYAAFEGSIYASAQWANVGI